MTPRVKELIKIYNKGNLQKVNEYLTQPEMVVDPSTWEGKIKKLIDDKLYGTAANEIELVGYKFKR
jgi:hypothetical protein